MSQTARSAPVLNIAQRVPPGPMRQVMDAMQSAIGKVVSFAHLALLKDLAGYQITNAASGAGTDIPEARTIVHFGDAGVDQVRIVARAQNSAAGSVTVQVYRVSGSTTIASLTITDATQATFLGAWTTITPTGQDEELGIRVVGNGAFDPTLFRVDLHMRTLQKAT